MIKKNRTNTRRYGGAELGIKKAASPAHLKNRADEQTESDTHRKPGQALGKKKQDDKACGEIGTARPGCLDSQDTFYVGTLKSVGRILSAAHPTRVGRTRLDAGYLPAQGGKRRTFCLTVKINEQYCIVKYSKV